MVDGALSWVEVINPRLDGMMNALVCLETGISIRHQKPNDHRIVLFDSNREVIEEIYTGSHFGAVNFMDQLKKKINLIVIEATE